METPKESEKTTDNEVVKTGEVVETPPAKTPDPKKETSLDDMLFGDDDRASYETQRGSRNREVIHGDDEEIEQPQTAQEAVSSGSINDEDRAAAKLFFWFYDDSSAKMFSQNVYGTWDNAVQFRVYKNLTSAEHKDLIECAALIYKRWKFRFGPEMVIAASLGTATYMKYSLAQQLKKQLAGRQAPPDNNQAQNQKIIDINKNRKQPPPRAQTML